MLDQTPKLPTAALQIPTQYDRKQRFKMIAALVLLLSALLVIVIKDAPNWFGSADDASADVDSSDSSGSQHSGPRVHKPLTQTPAKPATRPAVAASASSVPPPPAVVNRTALPPLEVEVVAGDSRKVVRPGNNAVKVELPDSEPSTTPSVNMPALSTNAGERVRMSADTTHVVQSPVEPSYPMLARQMKVQGAVVLQALIGTDGAIQDLRVLSGPAILASAAREAVRQWRFKPYLQNGAPVETQANITVNFTISTL